MRAMLIAVLLVVGAAPAFAPAATASHTCDPEIPCARHPDEALCSIKPIRTLLQKFVPNLCW